MRSKADETLVIVETLICPLQISQLIFILHQTGYVSTIKLSLFSGAMSFKSMKYIHQPTMHILPDNLYST